MWLVVYISLSLNAYVVFETEEAAKAALAHNMKEVGDVSYVMEGHLQSFTGFFWEICLYSSSYCVQPGPFEPHSYICLWVDV